MGISKNTVEKIALLSRLELSEEEKAEFAGQLGRIIDYMDMLEKLDTSKVPPSSHAAEMKNVFREDDPQEPLPPGKVFHNAPERHGSLFRVPEIIESRDES